MHRIGELAIAILQKTHLWQSLRPKDKISQEGFEECTTRNICDIPKLKNTEILKLFINTIVCVWYRNKLCLKNPITKPVFGLCLLQLMSLLQSANLRIFLIWKNVYFQVKKLITSIRNNSVLAFEIKMVYLSFTGIPYLLQMIQMRYSYQ